MASSGTDHRRRVIGELSRGREVADRLRLMLLRDMKGSSVVLPAHRGLVGEILDSFTHSLSILSSAAAADSDEASQLPTPKSEEDSGDSCKTPAPKDRRGCYKRRRTSETRVQETPTPVDDGYAWRKYGQKVILHSKHPRNYFRCTHKFDQKCQASKQVQKIQDDPPLFRTTYHGQHSCTNLMIKSHHQIIMDSTPQDSSMIWFGSTEPGAGSTNTSGVVIDDPNTTLNNINAIKREYYNQQTKSSSSSSPPHPDYLVSAAFDPCAHLAAAFSSGSDHGDVISCTESAHSMDPYIDGPDFDDFLQF